MAPRAPSTTATACRRPADERSPPAGSRVARTARRRARGGRAHPIEENPRWARDIPAHDRVQPLASSRVLTVEMPRRPRPPIRASRGAARTEPFGPPARISIERPSPGWSLPMRTTMSFLTSTSPIAGELPASPPVHRLEILGLDKVAGRIVLREHVGRDSALALLAVGGAGAGVTIPLGRGTRAAARSLVPLVPTAVEGFELTTRVIQRRGLRMFGDLAPIRKFALGLTVTAHTGGLAGARGRAVATAYLRPRATLTEVWRLPDEPLAVALVSYCGVPTGLGVDKQIAVLVTPSWQ